MTAAFAPHVLREYAFVADGCRGALIGPRGDVAWLCAPSWDSDAVISALVGGPGTYAVTPVETYVWGGYYEPGSLIWHSRWITTSTPIECQEALACPADPTIAVLVRRIDAVGGTARVRVVLDLHAAFGTADMDDVRKDEAGTWSARTGGLTVRWQGAGVAVLNEQGQLVADLEVPAGAHHDLVLEIGEHGLGPLPDPDRLWARTREYWAREVPALDRAIGPRDARHAYSVLRGLTLPGGGMVAAATLGLPERAEAGRNYDYRYVWLRDQAYAGLASAVDEPHQLLDDAVAFATARMLEHGDQIAPAYRPDGRPLPAEETLSLPGYPGGKVVVGNWVNGQFQLDAMGEVLQLLARAAKHDHLDGDGYRAMTTTIGVITQRWQQPEAGIWELSDAWWTQSRLSVVAGLRAAASQLAGPLARSCADLADAVLAQTSTTCLRPDGAWRRSPDHEGTDASLLLPPVRGALAAGDPRTTRTIDAVTRELTRDGYVYRFDQDDEPLGEAEGAFLLCGFTMALAQWHQGHLTDAARWYERTAAACGSPGLLAEEYDVQQRQLRGNLPQGFVHALLLEAGQRLAGPPR